MVDVSNSTRRTAEESAAIRAAARARGVQPDYVSAQGEPVSVPPGTLATVLGALGPESGATHVVPSFTATFVGTPALVPLGSSDPGPAEVNVTLVTEDGEDIPLTVRRVGDRPVVVVPPDVPEGYHELVVTGGGARGRAGEAHGVHTGPDPAIAEPLTGSDRANGPDPLTVGSGTVLVAPARAPEVEERAWGLTVQLYSVRSGRSWGIGDFGDLADLLALGAAHGADFVLINPIHAGRPLPPLENSPYLPSSRQAIDPIYLRIEDVPEFARARAEFRDRCAVLRAGWAEEARIGTPIDRDRVLADKLRALAELYLLTRTPAAGDDPDRAATVPTEALPGGARSARLARFIAEAPEGTRAWAAFNAAAVAENEAADAWPGVLQEPDFWMWTQFLAREQLEAAERTAQELGMSIGLMTDLAVGVSRDGADATALAEYFAPGVSVGAPADYYNQLGQDWSQPPWHPERLAEADYAPLRDLFRTAFTGAGGIRIDHAMGLFRLWWVPEGHAAKDGAYVAYDSEAILAVLVTEAARAGVVIVGEDLGTVAPGVRERLADLGILGTSVMWFERDAETGLLTDPEDYRELTLATLDTHDMMPLAGHLDLADVDLSEELHQLADDPEVVRAVERQDRQNVLEGLRAAGVPVPEGTVGSIRDHAAFSEAFHAYLARASSALLGVALTDVVGEARAQNKPGTSTEYPNWTVPLADGTGAPVLLDDFFTPGSGPAERLRTIAACFSAADHGRDDGGMPHLD
ncbi:4-alpha-glucanotransferase [Brevibacterium samyangense]|uniref:4-alpha-glucanotransferase n=1 Tax=Brevibacterium samyangense TaxID=366888 RepID=A0ABP5EN00_9MICO